jgi:hypothetical protein
MNESNTMTLPDPQIMGANKTLDLERFRNAVGFTATFRSWGNRRKGNISKVETGADKSRLRLTKELVVSKEYEAIISFFGDLKNNFIYVNTVPSFFKEGFQLVGVAGVPAIEKRMRKAQLELAELVAKFIAVYPDKVDEAKLALGDQFNPNDYPPAERIAALFSITWNWIAFTVPEGLPPELKALEKEKLEKQFRDAAEQITDALRAGFLEMIQHATERLTVEPGGKPKVFRDSVIGNIQEFIDTFTQRNLMNDEELAKLVKQAKQVLIGVTPQKLRDYAQTKDQTRKAFEEINAELSKMITEKPSRRFEMD